MRWVRVAAAAVAVLVLAGAGSVVAGRQPAASPTLVREPRPATTTAAPPTVPPSTEPPTTAPPSTLAPATTAAPPPTAAPATQPPRPRVVHDTGYAPFAVTGPLTLHHPSARVERVGFHQSGHDGAQQLEALVTAAAPLVLEDRGRDTGDRTAADVVADPELEVRAPVTGTVIRAGTYTLYCHHSDDYAVIEPDARPGWEVKVLHIDGVRVRKGDRVEAGVTVLAGRPTPLPFESQVDEHTAEPSWPHVHLEVVDPSVPDRPTKTPGC